MRSCIHFIVIFSLSGLVSNGAIAQNKREECQGQKDSLLNKYVFHTADEPAKPEGGIEALYRMLAKRLRYPVEYDEYYGRVIIGFVVEPNGKIDGKRVIKDPVAEKIFSKQLFKIIDEIKWNPAICNGRPVPYMMMLPVSIGLSE